MLTLNNLWDADSAVGTHERSQRRRRSYPVRPCSGATSGREPVCNFGLSVFGLWLFSLRCPSMSSARLSWCISLVTQDPTCCQDCQLLGYLFQCVKSELREHNRSDVLMYL